MSRCPAGARGLGRVLVLLLAVQAWAAASESLPDPTRPATARPAQATPSPSAPRYVLSAVLIGHDRRRAVINGRTVSEGDWVSGAQVVAVVPGKVRLRRDGREFTLELLPRDIKHRARQP